MQVEQGIFQLVDTGIPGSASHHQFIAALGKDSRELHDIVLTHFDMDHVGAAAALRARTGARVAIHELDAPVLTGEQGPKSRMRVVRVLYWLLVTRMVPDLCPGSAPARALERPGT